MKARLEAWLKKHPEAIWAIVLCALAFAIYAPTIRYDYAWDDDIVIRYNARVQQGFKGIPSHFVYRTRENFEDFTGYRPVSLTSLSIDIGIFGMHAWGGHLMNVVYFCLLVLVLFRTLRVLFPNYHAAFAFFIALLFVLHPLRVEAVANIKSRDELLALLFALLSLQFFIRHYRTGKWLQLLWSTVFIVLGALSKENALTYFAVFPLAIVFLEEGDWKRKAIGLVKFPILVVLVVLVFKAMTGAMPGSPTPVAAKGYMESLTLGNCMAVEFKSNWEQIGNSLFLYWENVRKFFWPNDLVYFSGYNMYSIKDWTEDRFLLGGLFDVLVAMLLLPLIFFKRLRVFGFGIWYFSVTILVYLQLPNFLIADTIADRFMTMPSVGLGIAVIWGIYMLLRLPLEVNPFLVLQKGGKEIAKKMRLPAYAIVGFAGVLVVALGGMSIVRSQVWKNNEALFSSDLVKLDNCARAHYYYANMRFESYDQAKDPVAARTEIETHYKKAISITPQSYYAYVRLLEAQIYKFKSYQDAENVADDALRYYAESADIWHYKGKAAYYSDHFEVASVAFGEANALDPNSTDTREFLARSLERAGKFDAAFSILQQSIRKDPDYLFYYDVLSDTYWDSGDTLQAYPPILKLIEKDGLNDVWWKKLIARYQMAGDNDNALRYYNEARNRGVLQ